MSRKAFSLLAIALVVVVAAIFLLLPATTSDDAIGTESALLPGLAARVNEVDRITVVGAGDTVLATLTRDDEGWTVSEFSGYPADLDTVRTVLGGLAQAKIIEQKTANPDYYPRLGVEELSLEDAGGIRLDLAAGQQRWSLIVGKEAANRGGFYLREAQTPTSVLADFDENIPQDAAAWVNTRVIDIMAGEVAEVQIVHPDGETLTARKVSADETDFTLVELPEGRELVSAWSINSLGSALSTLSFESVERLESADALDWDQAVRVQTVLFSGLTVDARLLDTQEGYLIRLEASAPFMEAAGEENPELQLAVDEINQRVSGWVYQIPAFKAEVLTKRPEDLLREVDSSNAPD